MAMRVTGCVLHACVTCETMDSLSALIVVLRFERFEVPLEGNRREIVFALTDTECVGERFFYKM